MASKNRMLFDEALQSNGTVPKKVETITPVPTVEPKPIGETPVVSSEVKVAPVAVQGNGNAANASTTNGGGSATVATTAQSGNTPTVTVPTPPEKKEAVAMPKPPSWQDLVKELQAVDEESETTKAEIRKKQKVAKAVAAISDFATHAMNVWGAHYGQNMPIKGAPMTGAVKTRENDRLSEHAQRIKERKETLSKKYESMQKDYTSALNNAYKESSLQLKWAENKRKAETAELNAELTKLRTEAKALEIKLRGEKNELEKKKIGTQMDLVRARIEQIYEGLEDVDNRYQETVRHHKATEKMASEGKNHVFVGNDGNPIKVQHNVWVSMWPMLYDAIVKDIATGEDGRSKVYHSTEKEKENYVKQQWMNSEAASKLMQTMGGIVTGGSYDLPDEEEEEEDWSQYESK